MTDREVAKHLASRQERAREIIVQSERFKVCGQCRSILYRDAAVCSICGAYRFKTSARLVRKTATQMSGHPFPVTSGTVPRIEAK